MKLLRLPTGLPESEQSKLQQKLFEENIQRTKLFAKIILLFEAALIMMNVSTALFDKNKTFSFDFYLIMYLLLTVLSIAFLMMIRFFEKGDRFSAKCVDGCRKGMLTVVVLFLAWGGVVTLVDQHHYGHIMAFAVNFMCVSVLFHATNRTMLKIYSLPVLIVYGGLPLFQSAADVLVGHYINLTVFTFFCWLTSRMLYANYYKDFYQNWMLSKVNRDLEVQIQKNTDMNKQLEKANKQLELLMLTDELTGIRNRRGFRSILTKEQKHASEERSVAFMMIDIDCFKQYNDFYGHIKGDTIIRSIAQTISQCIPVQDGFAARYGGEEFIVVLFDQSEESVKELGRAICRRICRLKIEHMLSTASDWVTISIGIKTGQFKDNVDTLLAQADDALYEAKKNGRNQVAVHYNKVDILEKKM